MTSADAQFDWEDEEIRDLIRGNHRPEEVGLTRVPYQFRVICGQCQEAWPCVPAKSLRAWEKDHPWSAAV